MKLLNFIRFVAECFLNLLGYVVGDSYESPLEKVKGIHGLVGGAIWLACAFALIKIFCLDHEGHEKRDGMVLFAIFIAFVISMLYFAVIYACFM